MELYTTPNVQDRTFEFQQCVNTFAKQEKRYIPPTQQPQQEQQQKSSNISKSEFSKNASIIAKDIARVTGSLSKLAQLAKRKQLFNDKPTDIIELTYIIKQDIFRIEKSLKNLQQQTGSQNSSSSGSSESQINTYNKNVVQLLNTKTKNISETFKEVLQTRQRNELQQRSRQEQLLAAVANTENSNSMNNNINSEIPYAVRSANKKNNNGIRATNSENPFLATLNTGDFANDNSNSMLSIPDQSQQMMLLEEQNNRYVQERSNAVEAIESTINEVGGLFQQLATMVQEQGEVIQRIDDNVEDVSLNISGAQRELMKYYNNVSSNRWLMLKIFGVLIVFFLLWVLVS